ncbi:EboA domain-containing protein [Carbonactinospora thermoautotrophica]|uniref:EboA domain-containing protein n=2 Tax=Carbonactinospora thermoautotrophica TaxID=1469144 RepID=UPI00099E687C|nr:EboA domain-containing protein [Carbonactinospora thermoautotrophica]
MTPQQLLAALDGRLGPDAARWLAGALARIARDPMAIRVLFPAAGRRCGRDPLETSDPGLHGWTVDDAVRGLMLAALPLRGDELAEETAALYRYGDTAERRGVLRALALLDARAGLGDRGLPIVRDALRTDDPRLVAVALGPYAAQRLDPPSYRQGVLKCLLLGIPLAEVHGLRERADPPLARMLADFVHERLLAGQEVPPEVWSLLDAYPGVPEASDAPDPGEAAQRPLVAPAEDHGTRG